MSLQNCTGKEVFGTAFFNEFIAKLNSEFSSYMRISGTEITSILNDINTKNSSQDTAISSLVTGLSSQVSALNTEKNRINTLNTNYTAIANSLGSLNDVVNNKSDLLDSTVTRVLDLEDRANIVEVKVSDITGRLEIVEQAATDVNTTIDNKIATAVTNLEEGINAVDSSLGGLAFRLNSGLLEVTSDGSVWNKVAMTANDILVALKTVDGTISGLDSDMVDGLHFRINSGLLESSLDGTTWVKAAMSTADLLAALNGQNLAVGNLNVGTAGAQNNYISFAGTPGDVINKFHTLIGERKYGESESSELFLYKGNDVGTAAGPDRIRMAAAEILFQTYSTTIPTDQSTFEAVAAHANLVTRMKLNTDGALDVTGRISAPYYLGQLRATDNTYASALLSNNSIRANDATGDTWIFADARTLDTNKFGIFHNQTADNIEFYGLNDPKFKFGLNDGNLTASKFTGNLDGNALTANTLSKIELTSGADLNTCLTEKTWFNGNTVICKSLLNLPVGRALDATEIVVENKFFKADGTYFEQTATIMHGTTTATSTKYRRKYNNGTFAEWIIVNDAYNNYAGSWQIRENTETESLEFVYG